MESLDLYGVEGILELEVFFAKGGTLEELDDFELCWVSLVSWLNRKTVMYVL